MSYAQFSYKDAWLSSDFGEQYARKKFGDDFVNSLPKYVKGKRKGKIKGMIKWIKCEQGGWVRQRQGGFVENRRGSVVHVAIITGDRWQGFKFVAHDDCGIDRYREIMVC
tara:strand:+ start:254 stop:583 length:330 start_codon:yes stop_codon:yes gene_type:complete